MEIFELRYFLEVARFQNIHRASESLSISPGSLSKAIARLENELKTRLFLREGRGIKLTDQGHHLKLRATELILLEQSTKMQILGKLGQIKVLVSGPEILLSNWGPSLMDQIKKMFPLSVFEFQPCDNEQALQKIKDGDAHLGLVWQSVPQDLTSKLLSETTFATAVGQGHPLYSFASIKKAVSVDEILKYQFVSPARGFLGQTAAKQSWDGWRDDKFTRKILCITSSLKTLETFVTTGKALAYLPDYYIKQIGALPLKITGCPYFCTNKINLVAKHPKDTGWLNQLF